MAVFLAGRARYRGPILTHVVTLGYETVTTTDFDYFDSIHLDIIVVLVEFF